jgi:2-oxoglutarate dehydrogenase complex dehydrogenase (E1) component-like enzyme
MWCQEEPMNQGAWGYMALQLGRVMQPGQQLLYAGRPASASPAVGYHDVHVEQQAALLDEALNTTASEGHQEVTLAPGMHVEIARKVKA